ncbi:hypothetical protein [Nocardioides flavescens]|uniref:Uncharacterized protein n=1 Tax=Nocardioides flavescens TaxID=2691959 RepID=A0A6L7F3B0_9ACTN|nr:hypothetical protein [Nocardioides flavescens]MXG91654.1 hypothetical protein [Nocardioides flavescens]
MTLNTNLWTVIDPSGFAMPACAHASLTTIERDRTQAIQTTQGFLGRTVAYVPGTLAWSPPLS